SSNVQLQGIQVVGSDVQISIQSYAGHGYQLQETASLSEPDWQNIGDAQDGTGGILTFIDADNLLESPQGCYRILVAP
ncbi:MAG: hypothetical protein H7Y43_09090, partial [Akkermansiaceae bacterium]|nr:hypothetical protein [Verrucomicrobiales bacterium]